MNFKNENKTLLILDLDETLVYATRTPLDRPADFQVPPYQVYKRPFLKEFIHHVRQHFFLAVWSSASDDYVHEMAVQIFGEETPLDFVWGRSRCTYQMNPRFDEYRNFVRDHQNHTPYLKTLKKVKNQGYRLERILMVDDTPQKLIRNYGNAIYIREFQGEPNDEELRLLWKYLELLKDEENVRTIEKRGWRFQVGGMGS
jgi:RNA polymerase II subunit A small phosphatase-like protein